MTGPKRAWVKWDRFALFDLAREHGLTPSEIVVLYALTHLADFRTGIWVGQIQELQSYTNVSRDTLRKARSRLEELKIIAELEPFHGGDGHLGSILILSYPQFVRDCKAEVTERIDKYLSEWTPPPLDEISSNGHQHPNGSGRPLDDDRTTIGRQLVQRSTKTRDDANPRGREAVG